MKKIISLLILITNLSGTAQTWRWAKQFVPAVTTYNLHFINGLTTKDGNVYACGYFQNSIDLGNGHTLTGGNDAFIAKFDSSGTCQWATQINVTTPGCGCSTGMWPNSISTNLAGFDSQGNLFVTGGYCGCGATFGNGITSSAVFGNIFIAKYNSSGLCQWVKTKSSSGNDAIYATSVDESDNVYIDMGNDATPSTFCGLNFNSQGEYFFKVNTNGIGIWSKQISTTTAGYGTSKIISKGDRVYSAVQFVGTVTFGVNTYTSLGSTDNAILKMDTAGNILSSTVCQSTGTDQSSDLVLGQNGDLFFLGNTNKDSVSINGTYLSTNSTHSQSYLVKYDTSLAVISYKNSATNQNAVGVFLATDRIGNLYMTANHFGSSSYDGFSVSGSGYDLIKMNNALNAQWVTRTSYYLTIDSLLNIYTFSNTNYGKQYGPFTENPSNGSFGLILAKIGQPVTGTGSRTTQATNMQVYPNPSAGLFNLKLGTSIKNNNNIKIMLYDLNGKLVDNVPYTKQDESTLQINLSGYAQGNYIVKAEVDNILYYAKLER